MIRRALLVLALLAFASRVEATTYYVSKSGNDSNSCETADNSPSGEPAQSSQKLTIQAGYNCLSAGDTLIIHTGRYDEGITANKIGTNWTIGSGAINVEAASGETVTIWSVGGPALFFDRTEYTIWTRVFLDCTNQTGGSGGCIQTQSGHHVRYQDGDIANSDWSGVTTSGSSCAFSSTCMTYYEFLRNVVHDGGRCNITNAPIGCDGAHGFYLAGSTNMLAGVDLHMLIEGNDIYGFAFDGTDSGLDVYAGSGVSDVMNGVTIRGNKIHNNGQGGFYADTTFGLLIESNQYYDNTGTGIVLFEQIDNAHIYNNTIVRNGDYGIEVGNNAASLAAIIKNNAIACNVSGSIIVRNTSGTSYATGTFNSFYLNGGLACAGSNNNPVDQNSLSTFSSNRTGNPGFTSLAGNDFTINASSDLYNTGTNLADDVGLDFLNASRPQVTTYDIGAYEYAGGGMGTPTITTGSPLTQCTRGTSCTVDITITGGTGTYSSCSVSLGTAPTGLTASIVSNKCRFTGTPSVVGQFVFTALVTDSGAMTDTQVYDWFVVEPLPDCSSPSVTGSWTRIACPGGSSLAGDDDAIGVTFNSTGADFGVCVVAFDKTATPPTLVDSKPNTWTQRGTSIQNTYGETRMYQSRLTSVGAGHDLSIDTGGAFSYPAFMCWIGSGSAASPFDQAAVGTAFTSQTSVQPGAFTGGFTKELYVVAMSNEHATDITASGFDVYQRTNTFEAFGVALAVKYSATALGSTNPTLTSSVTVDGGLTATSFKAIDSASAAGTCTRVRGVRRLRLLTCQ